MALAIRTAIWEGRKEGEGRKGKEEKERVREEEKRKEEKIKASISLQPAHAL